MHWNLMQRVKLLLLRTVVLNLAINERVHPQFAVLAWPLLAHDCAKYDSSCRHEQLRGPGQEKSLTCILRLNTTCADACCRLNVDEVAATSMDCLNLLGNCNQKQYPNAVVLSHACMTVQIASEIRNVHWTLWGITSLRPVRLCWIAGVMCTWNIAWESPSLGLPKTSLDNSWYVVKTIKLFTSLL